MTKVTKKGKTLEEAIQLALDELGITRDEAQVEVISEGKTGLLGFIGRQDAEVAVSYKQTDLFYEELTTDILSRMGFEVEVKSSKRNNDLYLEILSEDTGGLLIGKNGRTLNALQHIIKRIGSRNGIRNSRVTVDVSDYRRRHDRRLRDRALKMAAVAKRERREVTGPPLEAIDRRVIHRTLRNDSQVKTYSVGEGIFRNVVVAPANGGNRTNDRRDYE